VTASEATIVMAGEIDLANIDALREALRNARALNAPRIVVDVAEVNFLSVSAVRDLVEDRDITIVGASGITKRILQLLAASYGPDQPADFR
jgi:anti-anti-sigma factor